MISRILGFAAALGGAVAGSQLPEFSQQYRQRLGGALQELELVVVRFEQDASAVGLSIESALTELETADHELFQRRGISMRGHVTRYQQLSQQQQAFENLDPLYRPAALLQGYDKQTLDATWQAFEPAVPLNTSGGIWAGASAFLGFLALFLPAKVIGGLRGLLGLLFGRRTPRPSHRNSNVRRHDRARRHDRIGKV
jgi:hypothetical protein